MDIVILGIVIFLFLLACFDLMVGVSNDAVNFLNSAVGSKAAKFKHIIIVAAIGVFFGAVQDFAAMYASVKNKGRTIGYIIEEYIGKTGKKLFLLFHQFYILYK